MQGLLRLEGISTGGRDSLIIKSSGVYPTPVMISYQNAVTLFLEVFGLLAVAGESVASESWT